MATKTYEEEIGEIRKLMKVGISLYGASRTELGFGGSKTERIKERMVELDLIYKREHRWKLEEMNTRITLHYKIHRTRKKQEFHNWIEFEVDLSTIMEPSQSTEEVLDDLKLMGDEVASDILGGLQFDGVNEENISVEDYDTEDTEEEATYPDVEIEWLIRSPTYPSGTTGKESRRI